MSRVAVLVPAAAQPPRPQADSTSSTMPLSRTRSLLANINGSASASSTSSTTTPTTLGTVGDLHVPSNGGGYHHHHFSSASSSVYEHHLLPPLKAGSSAAATPSKSNGSSMHNGLFMSASTSGTNGTQIAFGKGGNGNNAGTTVKDFDSMSTTGSLMAAPVVSASNVNGGGLPPSSSSSSSLHLNGMQTLPHHMRQPSGQSDHHHHHHLQNGNGTLESPKHAQQQSSSTASASVTNGVVSGSNNGSTSAASTNGAMSANNVKPKTMVATPEQVMKLYMNKLTPYEHHEIFNYPQIYFIGANAKKRPGIIGAPNNCGYDDDQGSYTHIPHDHLAYRYEVLKVIGKGSFGQVVKAYDHKAHHHVALKMVRNEKRFHRQAQEEIRILEHLRKQDKDNTFNIIHLYDHFTFRSHTCITFELLSINLYELIKKNKFQGFSLQLVRKFAHSLLQCLDLLYRNKIIHCDMKPENVLLKQQGRSGIKVSETTQTFFHRKFIHSLSLKNSGRVPGVDIVENDAFHAGFRPRLA